MFYHHNILFGLLIRVHVSAGGSILRSLRLLRSGPLTSPFLALDTRQERVHAGVVVDGELGDYYYYQFLISQ